MKRTLTAVFAVLVCAACLLSAVACTGDKTPKTLTCTVNELYTEIAKVNGEGELFRFDSDRLNDDYQIDSSLYTEGFFAMPMESAGVETLAFFKASSEENAVKIREKLDTYVNDTRTYQKNYNENNYNVSMSAVTVVDGSYVYLVMSPAKDAVTAVIGKYFK